MNNKQNKLRMKMTRKIKVVKRPPPLKTNKKCPVCKDEFLFRRKACCGQSQDKLICRKCGYKEYIK